LKCLNYSLGGTILAFFMVFHNSVGESDSYVKSPNQRVISKIGNPKPLALAGLGSVQLYSGTNEDFEGFLVNLLAFMDIDGAPDGPRLGE